MVVRATEEQLSLAPWMRYAIEQEGVREIPGDKHDPRILQWIATCRGGDRRWAQRDEVPHCAAFVNACMMHARIKGTNSLAARSWLRWGDEIPLEQARMGDVVVFWRGAPLPKSVINAPGHVGFFLRQPVPNDVGHLPVYGANQQNAVRVALYPLRRLLSVRRANAADMVMRSIALRDA